MNIAEKLKITPEQYLESEKVAEIEIDTYNLEDIEKNIIVKVLKQNQGNVTQAATALGLTRTSLYRRMEKYGL